jgi:D-amino-acid dehydrogenase
MNIAIVGAGITGISTALEFARDGHQVTVYEQMNAAAEAWPRQAQECHSNS